MACIGPLNTHESGEGCILKSPYYQNSLVNLRILLGTFFWYVHDTQRFFSGPSLEESMLPYNNSNDYGTTSSSIITLTILSLLLCHVKPIKGPAANVIDYGRRCLNMRINEQQNSQDGTTCPHITSNTIHEIERKKT